jgi:hypothetical protein
MRVAGCVCEIDTGGVWGQTGAKRHATAAVVKK